MPSSPTTISSERLDADADQHVGAHAEIDEVVRELVGALLELGVGEPLVPELDGHRLGDGA